MGSHPKNRIRKKWGIQLKIAQYWRKFNKKILVKYKPYLVQRKYMDLAAKQPTILHQLQFEGIVRNQLYHPIDKCRLLDYAGTIQYTWSPHSSRTLWESSILSAMYRVGLENNGRSPKATETVDCLLKIDFCHSLRGMNGPMREKVKVNWICLLSFFFAISFLFTFYIWIVISWLLIRLTLSAESTKAIGDKIASINKHPLNIIGQTSTFIYGIFMKFA